MDRFHYLKYGLGLVLAFIGAKMLAMDVYAVPIALSAGRDRGSARRRHPAVVAAATGGQK
jgi:predicted tellurium resistance membrane protein TerC